MFLESNLLRQRDGDDARAPARAPCRSRRGALLRHIRAQLSRHVSLNGLFISSRCAPFGCEMSEKHIGASDANCILRGLRRALMRLPLFPLFA